MIKREEIFSFVSQQYGTEPEYPWSSAPKHAVLRHSSNDKWYGLIMSVPNKSLGILKDGYSEILNVKCDSIMLGSLLTNSSYYLPAYHMSKKSWISIRLDSDVPFEEVIDLLSMSYDMTNVKIRTNKK